MEPINLTLDTESIEPKLYIQPTIVLELDLETQAGSPLGMPDDLLDLGE